MAKNSDIPFLHRFDTWRARIEKFTSDEVVPAAKFDIDKDAQIAHARIAVATSNVIGKGPGNSVQRDFLSQAFSDFIFAIIIEELGLVGGVIVVFLYICLLIRVGRIAKKCDRTFPAFLIIGIALLLVSQAVFNMMVAEGLAPVTGQPLPLISKGGTECEPVHRQAGRTESARCPNHHAGGNRQRERKHLQRSAKRCRADSQDAEQRCRI